MNGGCRYLWFPITREKNLAVQCFHTIEFQYFEKF